MALGDGSAVRLTVSRYYTPTGRSIQRPYTNGDNSSYYNDYFKRMRTGELADKKSIEVDDSLKFTTPKGKVVYGGGGIIPDIFVPVDRLFDNETINYLRRRGHFGYFVFEELDKDRSVFANVAKYDFLNNFEVGDDMVVNFEVYVNRQEETNITFVAYIDDNAFEEIINKEDVMVQEVILLSSEYPNFTE